MKSTIYYCAAFLMLGTAANAQAAGVQPPDRPAVSTTIVPGEAKREREHTIHGHHTGKAKSTAAADMPALMPGKIDVAQADHQEKGK